MDPPCANAANAAPRISRRLSRQRFPSGERLSSIGTNVPGLITDTDRHDVLVIGGR